MEEQTREIVRYLGYGKSAVDERTLQLISELYSELKLIAKPKYIYRIFELSKPNENELQIGNMTIKSANLYHNLEECEQVILLGITLGLDVDRKLRQVEIQDMSKAIVFQACAATYLEQKCDALQEELAKQMVEDGIYLRPRFSPGYGDFSVLHQKDLLAILQAPKNIGLSLTDGCMLTPSKSVTAVIGLSKTKASCHQKGCSECTKQDCLYRRS